MIDAAQLGARLRSARERRNLSQQAVAEVLGLPRTAVTNIESGNRLISTVELTKLAALFDCSPAVFLDEERPNAEALALVLMRAIGAADDPAISAAVNQVWSLCREGANLRKLLGREIDQVVPSYASRLSTAGDAVRQGETVAREERRRLGLGNAPVGPIAELIGSQGVWVAACALPTDMSGLFLSDPTVGLSIVVNERHSAVRRRFSYAHEFGHALFDRDEGFRLTRQNNLNELAEKRANAFAAAFLMPSSGVSDQLRQLGKGLPSRHLQTLYDDANLVGADAEIRPRPGSQTITWQDVRQLARHFGVSYEGAVWRLKNLDHLRQPEVQPLLAQKGKNDDLNQILQISPEDPMLPDGREHGLQGQLVHLAIEAYRREEISQGRLRELAGQMKLSADALIDLAEAGQEG